MSKNSQLTLLQTILDQIADPVYVKNQKSEWVYVNDAFCQLLEKSREDLIGKTEKDFLAPEFADFIQEKNRAAFENPARFESEDVWRVKGEKKTFQVQKTVVSGAGREKLLVAIMRDFTDLSETTGKLQETEQRHRIIFDVAPIGVAYLGRNGRIKLANERMARILGYSSKELEDQNYGVLVHPDETEVSKDLTRLFAGEVLDLSFESQARHRSGEWIDVAVWIAGVSSADRVESAVVVLQDIRDRKRAEAKILDQQTQLFASSKMVSLGEMAGGIAHEINNPLAVIHGRAGQLRTFIQQGKFESKQFDQSLERIEVTAMKIAKIIKGIRAFARDGSADPHQMTSVQMVVEETLELCRARFRNHGVPLDLVAPIPPELQLECRGVQIGQVLLNLFNNAFDAVQKLEKKWVKLEVKDLGEKVEFRIMDSGSGISEEVRKKIMQPFFTTKEVGKGTGLGLSISKGIIEGHQGKLRLDLTTENTCFVIELPKFQAAQKAA